MKCFMNILDDDTFMILDVVWHTDYQPTASHKSPVRTCQNESCYPAVCHQATCAIAKR